MPQWAGSSWYFLRYMDPHNDKELVSKEAEEYWGPVDWYNGGMEHTTLHLLYSRFWHKFLYDIGVVHTSEPYAKRTSHGMILGRNPHYVGFAETEEEKEALIKKYGSLALRDSVKMSKSLGNVVNPDDVVKAYGADTMRVYIMFIGDFEKTATWSDEAVKGSKRFLDRCWNLMEQAKDDETEHEHIAGAPAVGSGFARNLIALDTSAGLHILPCEPASVADVHQETEGEHGDHDIDDGKCHEIATFLEQTVGSTELACECVDYREKVDGSVQKQEDDEESSAD
jgi:leucyl-tRNA synthetase